VLFNNAAMAHVNWLEEGLIAEYRSYVDAARVYVEG